MIIDFELSTPLLSYAIAEDKEKELERQRAARAKLDQILKES